MDSSQNFSIGDLEAFASRFYGGRPLLLTPYGYPVLFEALATGTSDVKTVNISANADFLFTMMHHRATLGAVQTVSSKTAPQVRVLLIDSGTAEQYTNSPVDLESYSTNGNIVNSLSYPRIISGRSSLSVQVTNYGPDTYDVLELYLDGMNIRPYSLPQ